MSALDSLHMPYEFIGKYKMPDGYWITMTFLVWRSETEFGFIEYFGRNMTGGEGKLNRIARVNKLVICQNNNIPVLWLRMRWVEKIVKQPELQELLLKWRRNPYFAPEPMTFDVPWQDKRHFTS